VLEHLSSELAFRVCERCDETLASRNLTTIRLVVAIFVGECFGDDATSDDNPVFQGAQSRSRTKHRPIVKPLI
jgi:hypothetical protein